MITPALIKEYKAYRRPIIGRQLFTGKPYMIQAPANGALRVARHELQLREAEAEDRIRFEWEYDQDYEPEAAGDDEESQRFLEHVIAMLNDGRYEALGCIAKMREKCPNCGHELEGNWTVAGSLWGIVVDVDDTHDYKREVEIDLALEAGVIG